jgi:hypothetical protein
MDKEEITRAAREAIGDLQLDCDITEVTKPIGKNMWCIQFTGSYGQFSDSFQDKAGEDNSARVIREKIKRFFLKQRKPTRIVRGRAPSTSARRASKSNLLSTLLEVGEGALRQATRITSEVVDRAVNLNRTVLKTEADWVETISPTAAEIIRPEGTGKTGIEVTTPQRTVEPVSAKPLPRAVAAPTVKPKKKAAAKGDREATKTSKARASKKSTTRTSKKSSARTTAKKSATKKKGSKTGRKTSKKKSASKKSPRAIRKFY